MAFVIQEATGVGQWKTIGKPYFKSLAAHGVLGKMKAANKTAILRVANERTNQTANPPKIGDLVSFMWLRGFGYVSGSNTFNLRAIDCAIAYVNSVSENLRANKKKAA